MMANNVNDTPIDSAQLIEGLAALGIATTIDELQRWAKKGIIPPYTTDYKRRPKRPRGRPPKPGGKKAKEWEKKERELEKEKGRPGRYSAWPPKTVEEAAAVWAVRHNGIKKPKTITNETIHQIKKIAKRVYMFPVASYELPQNIRLTGPNPQITYSYTSYKMKVVDDDELNGMIETWIAAREKARRKIAISQPKKVVFHWETVIKPPGFAYGLIFPIRGIAEECILILSKISLEEPDQDCDELVFLLDGTDSRKKVMYAPFDYYSPFVNYDPFETEEKILLAEDEVEPVDIEAAEKKTITIPLLNYWKLVQCRDVLEDAAANRKDITHEKAELTLQRIDPGEYDPDAPILVRVKK